MPAGKAPPNLFVLDVRTKAVSAVAGVPEDMSTGQVAMNPYCSKPGVARKAVNAAWDDCYNDFAPFSNIP